MALTDRDRTRIADINDAARTRYEQIRSNSDLSAEKKIRSVARAYLDQKRAIELVGERSSGTSKGDIQRLALKIYGLPAGADSLSYRDAIDRTLAIDPVTDYAPERSTTALLDQARITNDDILTRAVLKRAYDLGWSDIINTWLEDNPTQQADAQKLWDALQAQGPQQTAVDNLHLSVNTPPEVAAYSPDAIASIAANEDINLF